VCTIKTYILKLKQVFLKLKDKVKELKKQLMDKAKRLKKDLKVIYLAYKRPDVPWYAKLVAIIVVGYALSPLDLIPDFIPILGLIDDLIIIPLGISLVIKLIPKNILEECRTQSDEVFKGGKPKYWIAGALIIGLWLVVIGYFLYRIWGYFHK
jgi:uncharacterized membrane protein YkvA (DUF1232 family)